MCAWRAELPGARASVLARLWRALLFEPLPVDRSRLAGPPRRPYDTGGDAPGLTVRLDGRAYTHPAALAEALGLGRAPADAPGTAEPGTAGPGTAAPGTAESGSAESGTAATGASDGPGRTDLVAELDHSVVSLALSRTSPLARSPRLGRTLAEAERTLVDGHPYHPGCRSRPDLSVAEQLAYAPEHSATVPLELLAVPADGLLLVGEWPRQLRRADGTVLLPLHPWQARHVLPRLADRIPFPPPLPTPVATPVPTAPAAPTPDLHPADALSATARLGDADAPSARPGPSAGGTLTAAPLMSVRTLALPDGGPHLKTALSLRMTSAVRDISGASIGTALLLSDLLSGVAAKARGELRIVRNLAAAAVLVDGEPSRDLAAMVREDPEVHCPPGARLLPLAALAAHPLQSADPVGWTAALARLAFEPLLHLLDWGVALEAHGQNLLVAVDAVDGTPLRLAYRDLADVRISPARLDRAGLERPQLSGHFVDDDPRTLRRKLYGSLVGGALGALVSGLGRGDRAAEARLWSAVAAEAVAAADVLSDPDDRRALLDRPLSVKALTAMRLPGAPPGDRWTEVPNPLASPDAWWRAL